MSKKNSDGYSEKRELIVTGHTRPYVLGHSDEELARD